MYYKDGVTSSQKMPSSEEYCNEYTDQLFFDVRSTVHKEFFSNGKTVISEYYCNTEADSRRYLSKNTRILNKRLKRDVIS